MDKKNNLELIEYILKSISLVEERFDTIKSSGDLLELKSIVRMVKKGIDIGE
jgi:hypothetical protein